MTIRCNKVVPKQNLLLVLTDLSDLSCFHGPKKKDVDHRTDQIDGLIMQHFISREYRICEFQYLSSLMDVRAHTLPQW